MILNKPIITEKSMISVTAGKYVFRVSNKANKPEIAKEIFIMYKVKPVKINIINVKGESRLIKGKILSTTKSWKKAIVTLKRGDKIPGFEEK